ncbi:hypothetical protein [Burkholderia stagnalis]|uniref:hypothetical protein n=1 Tax=Burkholderia stagnalis TaxID=1503054 RepID=UPI000A596B41|nr:hypothetical protein [Burkholderia stagnalis]
MTTKHTTGWPMAVFAAMILASCGGGDDSPAPAAATGSASPTPTSNLECDPVYQPGDTVKLHVYLQASPQGQIVDNGIYTRTYAPATFQGVSLTQQAETTPGSPIQTNRYYLVGNGARTYYGGEVVSAGALVLRDVNSPPYAETIGLSGSESANYVDTPVAPAAGASTSVSIDRAYVARESVTLKNGKVFNNACHYHATEKLTGPAMTSTTIADDWLAPGVGLVKSVASNGGGQVVTRELDSATVGGTTF